MRVGGKVISLYSKPHPEKTEGIFVLKTPSWKTQIH
jgi:hypothetical protein